MNQGTIYLSYLVRLWSEELPGGKGGEPAWQGEVLHIQSGHKTLFQDKEQLLGYLLEQLAQEGDPTAAPDG